MKRTLKESIPFVLLLLWVLISYLLTGCSTVKKSLDKSKSSSDSTIVRQQESTTNDRTDSSGSRTYSEQRQADIEIEFESGEVVRMPVDSSGYTRPFPISRISYRRDGAIDISGPIKSIKASGKVLTERKDTASKNKEQATNTTAAEQKHVRTEQKTKELDKQVQTSGKGIIAGIVVLVALFGTLFYFFGLPRKRKREE